MLLAPSLCSVDVLLKLSEQELRALQATLVLGLGQRCLKHSCHTEATPKLSPKSPQVTVRGPNPGALDKNHVHICTHRRGNSLVFRSHLHFKSISVGQSFLIRLLPKQKLLPAIKMFLGKMAIEYDFVFKMLV